MKTLKEARLAKGIKACAVAEHLGITRQTYAKYEANPEAMSVMHAQAVCDFLGVPVSEIFFAQRGKKH